MIEVIEYFKKHIKEFWLSYVLLILAIYFLSIRGTYTFLDLIDLLIHEPGHLLFGLFGEFFQFLGGTLMQILLPLFVALVAFFRGWKYMAQIFLFWLGHNFINISVYVDDANKMKLNIIGGSHDWNWILNRIDLIEYSEELGLMFVGFSIVSFIIMFIIPVWLRNYDDVLGDNE